VKALLRRGRNEHPGVPDKPKPRRTAEQIAAEDVAAKTRADIRAVLIAEKRRQRAELEAEEALADQEEQTAFVGRIEAAEGDGGEMSPKAMEIDLPEMRLDDEDPDDASERKEAALKKTKKPRQAKDAAEATGAEADASKKGKGKEKQKSNKKAKVISSTCSCAILLMSVRSRSRAVPAPRSRRCGLSSSARRLRQVRRSQSHDVETRDAWLIQVCCRSKIPVGLVANWKSKVAGSAPVAKEMQTSPKKKKLGGLHDDDAVAARPEVNKGHVLVSDA
jgi:hypothetical protein